MAIPMNKPGFTLLELLVVMSVTLILFSLASVSYRGYGVRAKRHQAELVLLQLSAKLETYAADHQGSYLGATLARLNMQQLAKNLPYQFALQAVEPSYYVLLAIPMAEQARSDKKCGALLLTSDNEKHALGPQNRACWK